MSKLSESLKKRVQDAVDRVGGPPEHSRELQVEGLDTIIQCLTKLRKDLVEKGSTCTINVKFKQFRYMEPEYHVGSDVPVCFNQVGPIVHEITILEYSK